MNFKWNAVAVALLVGTAVSGAKDAPLPPPNAFLFWTPAQQRIGYPNIEKIFSTRIVKRGPTISPLPHAAKPFDVSYEFKGKHFDTNAFMAANNVSGLLIVQNGRVLLERYGLAATRMIAGRRFP